MIGAQRFGLLAGPIQRNHQLAPESLPEGELLDEALQLREHRPVSRALEIGRDPVFETHQAELLETGDLGRGEVVVGEVLKGTSAPEVERLGQPLPSEIETSLLQGSPTPVGQRLESPHVELVWSRRRSYPPATVATAP